MIQIFNRPFCVALFFLVFSACGEEETDETNQVNLVGTWVVNCEEDEGTYSTSTYVFTDTDVKVTVDHFGKDSTCQSMQLSTVFESSYKSGVEAASDTSVEGATPIDFTFTKSSIVLKADETVQNYNSEKICARTWKKDEEYLIAPDCETFKAFAEGTTHFTIFKATEDKLFFGESDDNDETSGTSADKRDTKLGSSSYSRG